VIMAAHTVDVMVRMYHVGFGDCFLLTIQGERSHRVLIDCGTHSGTLLKDSDPTFEECVAEIVTDIKKLAATDPEDCKGPDLDVVVVTHRHRDHVHGFSFHDLWRDVTVGEVWMPWVENLRDPMARGIRDKQEDSARVAFHALKSLSASLRGASGSDPLAAKRVKQVDEAIDIVYNSTNNAKAFEQLRGKHGFTGNGAKARYLPRTGFRPDRLGTAELDKVLPHTVVHVLGPSHDARVIKNLDPPAGAGYLRLLGTKEGLESLECERTDECAAAPIPFEGSWTAEEDDYGFDESPLVDLRALCARALDSPLQIAYRIDNALNGTSLVLLFEIGDVKLLFPGDAQWGTWQVILEDERTAKLLDRLTLYKVGHHGSHNATPREFVEKKLKQSTEAALVSVAKTSYGGGWTEIPKDELVDALKERTLVLRSDKDTRDKPDNVKRTKRYTQITVQAKVK